MPALDQIPLTITLQPMTTCQMNGQAKEIMSQPNVKFKCRIQKMVRKVF